MKPVSVLSDTTHDAALCLAQKKAAATPDVSHFDKLPDAALIAIKALATVLGKGVSTAWRDIKNDPDFPQPIRLGAGCTRFKVGDIRAYLAKKTSASTRQNLFSARKAR